jgi:hypothetical protein
MLTLTRLRRCEAVAAARAASASAMLRCRFTGRCINHGWVLGRGMGLMEGGLKRIDYKISMN